MNTPTYRTLHRTLNRLIICLFFSITALAATAGRIAILSDIHVTPGNPYEEPLRQAVAEINALPLQAVVVCGDLTNEGSDAELANVKAILDSIRHPLYVIPGNHENNWSQSATHSFINMWGSDRFVAHVDSLLLVGINCGPFMKMGDGHIKQEDLHWLQATLAKNCTPGTRVVSFCHYALNPDLDNYADYIRVLEQYPVIALFNGHYHTWRRYQAGDLDGTFVRSLDLKDGTFGYTIVDIDPDWVHIYNKNIGDPIQPKYAFPVRTDHAKADIPARPSFQSPEGFTVQQVWADSASIFTRLAIDNRNVYFGNSLGQAKAVDKATGNLAWTIPTGASLFSRPAVLNKGTIAFPADAAIIIADARTGRPLKSIQNLNGPYVADGAVSGNAWLQGAYKRFERRDARSGKLVWSYDSINNYCQAAPAIDGSDVIFGAWDTKLRCLDLNTGKLRWAWDNGKKANMLGPGNVVPVIADDKVFIVAPDRYITAIDRATGQTIWRDNSHKYRESLGHSADLSRIYAKTMDGELVAVDARPDSFTELWTLDLGLGYDHAPCIVLEQDGIVYVGSRRGIVTAVDPDTPNAPKVLWSLPLGVSEVNGFDIDPSTGDVYTSLIEGSIWRISQNK